MTTEKLVQALGERLSRRGFLASLGAGTVGALLGLMGLPQVAEAVAPVHVFCCTLCYNPGASCGTNCPYAWCWTCIHSCATWLCCECIRPGAQCSGECGNVRSSWIKCIAGCCPQSPQG